MTDLERRIQAKQDRIDSPDPWQVAFPEVDQEARSDWLDERKVEQ